MMHAIINYYVTERQYPHKLTSHFYDKPQVLLWLHRYYNKKGGNVAEPSKPVSGAKVNQ